MGIFSDGSLIPLTLRQRMMFGDSDSRLRYKLTKVREKAAEIIEMLEEFQEWEVELKDTRLIRAFTVECLSPLKRIAFKMKAEDFDDRGCFEKPSWFMYFFSWVCIIGALCFYIYWVFAWGVKNGGETLNAWGSVFGVDAATDMFLVMITKIIILNYLPAVVMQPQLIRIRRVLADLSIDYLNRHDPSEGGTEAVDEKEEQELRVVQHMSAACRASYQHSVKSLPSAWLLQQVREV